MNFFDSPEKAIDWLITKRRPDLIGRRRDAQTFHEATGIMVNDGDAITWQHFHDAAHRLDEKVCAVCHGECVEGSRDDRWHWGPDGLHCHFRCEDEFRQKYAGDLSPPGAVHPRVNNRVLS